jgi:cysteine-rich repeat protein
MSRAMRLDVRAWLAAGALACALAGCFDPQYPAGLVCSERQTCPPGQTCDGEICRLPILDAAPSDASFDGAVADAAELDAAPDAAAPDDAAPDDAAVDGMPPDASSICGDGVREGGEGCDDGNTTDDGNGCSAGCESSPLVGCTDGLRDAFFGLAAYPSIAACAGAWTTPGLHVGPSGCVGNGDDAPTVPGSCTAADLWAGTSARATMRSPSAAVRTPAPTSYPRTSSPSMPPGRAPRAAGSVSTPAPTMCSAAAA